MKILIENYRGFDLFFNKNSEEFECAISDLFSKGSKSYKAIKSYIDQYKKENQSFEPFSIQGHPDGYRRHEVLSIVGQRKDGNFVAEKGDHKVVISKYDLSDYILCYAENDELNREIGELDKYKSDLIDKINKQKSELISKMKITTLKEFKKSMEE